MSDDEMNGIPNGEDPNDEDSNDEDPNDEDSNDEDSNDEDSNDEDSNDDPLDDYSEDDYSDMSEEEVERELDRLVNEKDHLDKSLLVLSSLSKHTTRLKKVLRAISDSYNTGSGPSPKLIGERRYVERQILLGIDSLSEFDSEIFKDFSSEYEYIATRLQTSEEEEEEAR